MAQHIVSMPPSARASEINALWNEPADCSITFCDGGTVACSSRLLAVMSPYFEAALHHGFKESLSQSGHLNLPEVDQHTFMALAHLARGLPVAASDVLELWGKADLLGMQEVSSALETALAESVTVDTCIGWLGYCMYHRVLKQVASRARRVALANIERVVPDMEILPLLVQDNQLAVLSEDVVLRIVLGMENPNGLLRHVRGGLLSAAALQSLAPDQQALVLRSSKAYDVRKGLDIPWQGVQAEVVTTTKKVTAMYASEAGLFIGYADDTLEMPTGHAVSLKQPRQRKDSHILAIFVSGNDVICNHDGKLRVLTTLGQVQEMEINIGVERQTTQWKNLAVWSDLILHAHHDHAIQAYRGGQCVWRLECSCRGMQVWGDAVYFIQNVGSDSQRRGIFKSDLHDPERSVVLVLESKNAKDLLVHSNLLYVVDAVGNVVRYSLRASATLKTSRIKGFVRPTGMADVKLIASGSKLLCTHGAKEERLAVLDMNTLTTEHNFDFGESFGMIASVPGGDVWATFLSPSSNSSKVMVWRRSRDRG